MTPAGHSELRTVGVVAHPRRDCNQVLTAVRDWCERERAQIVTPSGSALLAALGTTVDDGTFSEQTDLIIAAGGDGTILRALALAAPRRVPVLGVNVGRLGFLAEVDPPELHQALEAISTGNYTVEERLALHGVVTVDQQSVDVRASNDLVLARIPGRGQAAFAVSVDGELFIRYVGDGLIVSTPTGSTAYSLSAGGPIVSPTTQAILLTAIAPHSVFDRSVVIAPTETLRVDLLTDSAPVVLECDGSQRSELPAGGSLTVTVSASPGLLVRLGGTTFYGRARRKLQLVDPLVLGTPGEESRD